MTDISRGHARRREAVLLALLVCAVFTRPWPVIAAAGDEVTPWNYKVWADGAQVSYLLSSTVPSWLKPIMRDVLEVKYDDLDTNNSDGPRYYEVSSSQLVTVYEVTAADAPAFCAANFLGCATSNAPRRIWIREDPINGYGAHEWCHVDLDDTCIDVGRVAIHEVGHMSGYLNHYGAGSAFARSRMTALRRRFR